MDGTIGDEFVVKPLPASIRTQIDRNPDLHDVVDTEYPTFGYQTQPEPFNGHRRTNETDDYEFLDEEEDLEDDDVMVPSPNRIGANSRRVSIGQAWRRRGKRDVLEKENIRSEFHIVYKRKDSHLSHSSDYSMPF